MIKTYSFCMFFCLSLLITSNSSATTEYPEEVKCAVCGETSKQYIIMSTSTFGSPDLDLRPAQMRRSTMKMWVQQCPGCGYCNSSLDDKTSATKSFLASGEYKTLFKEVGTDTLAAKFLYQVKIHENDKEYSSVPYLYLFAAWDCDDARNAEGAKKCRQAALEAFEKYKNKLDGDEETIACQKIDIMRRLGQFDNAQKLAQKQLKTVKQTVIRNILTFQIEKSQAKDEACYRVSDAQKE